MLDWGRSASSISAPSAALHTPSASPPRLACSYTTASRVLSACVHIPHSFAHLVVNPSVAMVCSGRHGLPKQRLEASEPREAKDRLACPWAWLIETGDLQERHFARQPGRQPVGGRGPHFRVAARVRHDAHSNCHTERQRASPSASLALLSLLHQLTRTPTHTHTHTLPTHTPCSASPSPRSAPSPRRPSLAARSSRRPPRATSSRRPTSSTTRRARRSRRVRRSRRCSLSLSSLRDPVVERDADETRPPSLLRLVPCCLGAVPSFLSQRTGIEQVETVTESVKETVNSVRAPLSSLSLQPSGALTPSPPRPRAGHGQAKQAADQNASGDLATEAKKAAADLEGAPSRARPTCARRPRRSAQSSTGSREEGVAS